ncbi:phage holin family protein [Anaerococcus sp. AGMB00486]|uniref:Phage holin family protein n=1 Tax=Anaerococcus faecalis TaxID=2742993 RepID=A0ABX2N6W4_9FIRM|nr:MULTISPECIES: phage holin family protein [Anaerococcus]MDY3005986.1 phage holin family protein [Anaerococcus porci]NVF10432.1 phage holin family protein [Anaerococcus faecalis]
MFFIGRLFLSWITNGISLYIIDLLFTGISFTEIKSLAITALMLMIVNSFIKPILKLLSLPLTIITFGLFSFIVNAFVLKLAFSLSSGAFIDSFTTAIFASIILSIINPILDSSFKKN